MRSQFQTFALSALIFTAVAIVGTPGRASADSGEFDHSAWAGLLKQFVKKGAVSYTKWHADGEARKALDGYLASLASADPKAIASRDARMAFWINAYNACALDAVLDRFPIKSVMDVKGFFKTAHCTVAGKRRSLDDIEKGVLRKKPFGDPRLHFALNCASKSCPPLLSRPWSGKGIGGQLDKATEAFIKSGGARVDGPKLHASKLFEWYAGDFKKTAPSIPAFIGQYLPAAGAQGLTISYDEYDWSLNGR